MRPLYSIYLFVALILFGTPALASLSCWQNYISIQVSGPTVGKLEKQKTCVQRSCDQDRMDLEVLIYKNKQQGPNARSIINTHSFEDARNNLIRECVGELARIDAEIQYLRGQ